jgi:hypothetical protein
MVRYRTFLPEWIYCTNKVAKEIHIAQRDDKNVQQFWDWHYAFLQPTLGPILA